MLDVITRRVKRLSVRARTKAAYSVPRLPVARSSYSLIPSSDEREVAEISERINAAVRAGKWKTIRFHGPECCGSKP